jgi:energy-coupling factor transporter transmembrane protein EcfT
MVMIKFLLLIRGMSSLTLPQGFYTVFICGAMSGGYIAGNKGLAWIHWVNVILSGVLLVACLILVPETRYIRDQTQTSSQNDKSRDVETKGGTEVVEDIAIQALGSHSKSHAHSASMWKLNKYQGDCWRSDDPHVIRS